MIRSGVGRQVALPNGIPQMGKMLTAVGHVGGTARPRRHASAFDSGGPVASCPGRGCGREC